MATECTRFLERTSDFMDGRLADEEQSECRLHVESCPRCASYIQTLERGTELLRGFSVPPLSDGFHRRLQHRLLHEHDHQALAQPALNSGTSAVALFAMAILIAAVAWTPVFQGMQGLATQSQSPTAVAPAADAAADGQVAARPLFRQVSESGVRFENTDPQPTLDEMWADSRDRFFQLAPISERYRDLTATRLGLN